MVLDERLIYEILSVWQGCNIWTDRRIDRAGQEREACGKGAEYGGILWELSVPQSGKSCRQAGTEFL